MWELTWSYHSAIWQPFQQQCYQRRLSNFRAIQQNGNSCLPCGGFLVDASIMVVRLNNRANISSYPTHSAVITRILYELHRFSDYRPIECLFNRFFWHTSHKHKTSALLVLCEGNTLVTSGFPPESVSNAESVPMLRIVEFSRIRLYPWPYRHDYKTFTDSTSCPRELCSVIVTAIMKSLLLADEKYDWQSQTSFRKHFAKWKMWVICRSSLLVSPWQ